MLGEFGQDPQDTSTTCTADSSIGFVYMSVNQEQTGLGHKLFHLVQDSGFVVIMTSL